MPVEAATPVESTLPVVARAAPKAPAAHVAHSRIKADREEARTPRRIADKRPHAPAARAPGAASRHAAAAPKAKPKGGLQRRADLEN